MIKCLHGSNLNDLRFVEDFSGVVVHQARIHKNAASGFPAPKLLPDGGEDSMYDGPHDGKPYSNVQSASEEAIPSSQADLIGALSGIPVHCLLATASMDMSEDM